MPRTVDGMGNIWQRMLSEMTSEELSGSYGDALKGLKVIDVAGEASIMVESLFATSGRDWAEVSLRIPARKYPLQDYGSVSFDVYF